MTHDITKYTKAKLFSEIGKKTEVLARFSTVAGELGAADAERDVRGFSLKFYTEEGDWDMVGNNTPVFFIRDPLKFPDFIHTQKRHPKTNLRSTPRSTRATRRASAPRGRRSRRDRPERQETAGGRNTRGPHGVSRWKSTKARRVIHQVDALR